MNRTHRPSPMSLSTAVDMPERGYESGSTIHLLTPGSTADTGSLSGTPSPLSSPVYPDEAYPNPSTLPSVFASQRYHPQTPYAHHHASYTPSGSQYPNPNLHRRASIAVEPSYQYTFPRSVSSVAPPSASPTLSAAEQEGLPSWRRDFDKLSDPLVKARWSRELYNDFLAGRIPMTGRVAQDIIDWETCVAKVNGEKDACATAKMLVAAQERKAELQTTATRLKVSLGDKEPPRRQNKFICYRSLRSSQLAAHFTSFKQSQFSAVTSLEWKEIDTDWWGEVADYVEEVRRAKYFGQLDSKGNPLRRGSMDSQYSEPTTPGQKPRRQSKSAKQTPRRNSISSRYDPYSTTTPMRPTASRLVSYTGSPQSHLTPPSSLAYRHSIDMGTMTMPGLVSHPSCGSDDSGLGLYELQEDESMSAAASFPALTSIPQSPITIHHGASTYTPASDHPHEYPAFSNPFAGTYHSSQIPATPISSLHSGLSTPFQSAHSYHGPSLLATPPYSSPHEAPATHQSAPHVYVPHTWTPHGRGATNELMERYTMAQDYVPATGHGQAQGQCWAQGEWTSHHPGMVTR